MEENLNKTIIDTGKGYKISYKRHNPPKSRFNEIVESKHAPGVMMDVYLTKHEQDAFDPDLKDYE